MASFDVVSIDSTPLLDACNNESWSTVAELIKNGSSLEAKVGNPGFAGFANNLKKCHITGA